MTTVEESGNKILKQGIEKISFDEGGLVRLQTMDAALAWGQAMIDSGFAPRGFERPAQVLFACQRGAELGVLPTAALSGFYPAPGGLLGIKVELALAVLRGKRLLVEDRFEYSGDEGKPDRTCTWIFRRRGWAKDRWESSSFSLREAANAGLMKDGSGWRKYPDRMLKARAISFGTKDWFSDVLLGVAVGEEPLVEEEPRARTLPPSRPPSRPKGPVKDPFLEDVVDVESKPVEEVVEPEPEDQPQVAESSAPALTYDDLIREVRERTGSDHEACTKLLGECADAFEAHPDGGLEAAWAHLRQHEIFGDSPQADLFS